MAIGTQPELIRREAHPRKAADFFRARLPQTMLLNTSDVAEALMASSQKIIAWIDDGTLPAVNIGSKDKPFYKIYRPDVLALIRKITGEPEEDSRGPGCVGLRPGKEAEYAEKKRREKR